MIRCKTLRLHPCILLMVLFMGWADARSQTIQPPSVESPVGLRQVTVIPNLSRQGLNGIGIAYQLLGSQPGPEVTNLWASLQTWSLTCRLYDENRFPLPATQGTR
ncbi:MAG TPA: hypothetical protein VHS96_17115, partial [Bacteroidia bacterium]|nr:hypothetical protein [Bacteroidia bacterium]